MSDSIDRKAAIANAISGLVRIENGEKWIRVSEVRESLLNMPSAEPEQRYTEEELRVFAHGISLSLLSKRSAQYWRYDKDTATEIEFLEQLYDKVSADMRGEKGR